MTEALHAGLGIVSFVFFGIGAACLLLSLYRAREEKSDPAELSEDIALLTLAACLMLAGIGIKVLILH